MTASRAVLGKIGTDENHFIKAKAGSTTNKQVSRNEQKTKTKHKTIFFHFSSLHLTFSVLSIASFSLPVWLQVNRQLSPERGSLIYKM